MSGDGECADVWQTVPICEHSGEAGVSAVESTDLAFVATVVLIVFAVIIVFAIAIAIVAAVTVVLVTVVLMGPMTRDPRVVAALRCPVSLGPYVAGARRIRLPFIAGGQRALPYINSNLRC